MQKDPETGIINNVGHEQKCVGCWMCIMACPYGVINKTGRNYKSCVSACPNEVLEYYEA
jgi:carbon-monoxide dehydrogenase iron sulfur subunit